MAESISSARLWLTRLAVIGVLITATVVALGAWTRLEDAGLGCPDWPTCYGSITVPLTAQAIEQGQALYPDQPFSAEKAWPEMIHRHFAKTIGLLCILMAGIALWASRKDKEIPVKHAVFLLFMVCLQGAFGAWTVTMKLFPPVVTGHLLLGFATFTTLVLLVARLSPFLKASGNKSVASLLPFTLLVSVVLVLQIGLGGWTASNYAATVCTALPVCQDGWHEVMNLPEAFAIHTYAGTTYEFAPHLGAAEKISIHVMHRLGAWTTTVLLSVLCVLLWLRAAGCRYRRFAIFLAGGLLVQILLGVSNVLFGLPLAVAVAHNVMALLLLQIVVLLVFSLVREKRS
ncbi:MAG: COX15/CtaA family protein [Moraxellaceae bacterium]|nr:COX15/CtaA family protein [Moraxellaceae bacterium]MBP7229040.1 COX15/CtaA family protein [Moraxellaceae bacterium]MBP9046329.1 COX15/CtaA family protein [Moraxellaceae bacterium]MBP9730848.1 COX15/CtaA family protein [Moraxellaceae bacterium]